MDHMRISGTVKMGYYIKCYKNYVKKLFSKLVKQPDTGSYMASSFQEYLPCNSATSILVNMVKLMVQQF